MPALMIKEEAHKLVDRLPERTTWDDLMHEIYIYHIKPDQIDVLAVIHGARDILRDDESE